MRALIENLERFQVPLYLAAILGAAVAALAAPPLAAPAELTVQPALALLLYATFLGVPFGRLRAATRDGRFLAAILAVNFAVVPLVVFALSRVVAHDQALLVGVLFVLLAPCIDYVIVFNGLAGGAHDRLLAATPLLMLAQMILLPFYLWWFTGASLSIEPAPFLRAFAFLVAAPLAAAALTQIAARRFAAARAMQRFALDSMVPLMMLTLAAVVASQISGVRAQLGLLIITVPVFALFAAVMVPVGMLVGRFARLDTPGTRALVFSGATRNSLVILPLALALPSAFQLVPLVVVTQTLVELLVMVIFVRLIPRLVTTRSGTALDS
ncbi:arsenic resistance protein [Leucobacter salsicius]|uniref:arsenic resistance protein n=1 Tax=Leucobacter salsicius TaxID=664638 RepID=UPI00034D0183|nr:bile acid:sodium symporter [Leucobacter salsicius]